jgi:hypothetical protein
MDDDVVNEVRAVREAFEAVHGYEIAAMVAALREYAAATGRQTVRLSPRPAVYGPPVEMPRPVDGRNGTEPRPAAPCKQ